MSCPAFLYATPFSDALMPFFVMHVFLSLFPFFFMRGPLTPWAVGIPGGTAGQEVGRAGEIAVRPSWWHAFAESGIFGMGQYRFVVPGRESFGLLGEVIAGSHEQLGACSCS